MFFTLKLGQFLLFSALLTSLFGLLTSFRAKDTKILSGLNKLSLLLIFMACFDLVVSLVNGHYFIKFVSSHSNSHLPLIYKITALWGGQEGSILFWSLLLSFQLSICDIKSNISYAVGFFTLSFFLFLANFISPALSFLYPPPEDGRELNPLLQHFGMVLHPVFLYMGLTGTVIPFSLYIGKIFDTGQNINYRKWAVFNWAWLTAGIIVGGWWAYSELGWGGYWAWDPVENASFIPWLTLTAFLHISMMEDKFRVLRGFSLILISITFIMAMTGTFLVRSGVFISVHSFLQNPELGISFLIFISVLVVITSYIFFANSDKLRKRFSLKFFSREFFIILGSLILISMWVGVFTGTIFPVIYESITGDKISFGKPFFNKIFAPLSLLLIIVMGFGQYLSWGDSRYKLKFFIPPLFLSFLVGAIAYFKFGFGIAIGLLSISFGVFVIFFEWIRDGVRMGRFFPLLAHLGFFIMSSGILFSQLLYKEGEFALLPEDEITFYEYKIKLLGLESVRGPNWEGIRANFEVSDDSREFKISSEKRMYLTWDEPTTEAGIKWGILKDFYIVFVKVENNKVFVKIWDNPLISFIWVGAFMMFVAGIGKFLKKTFFDRPYSEMKIN
ncbi:Cytochrome c-type biogenesis protein CcmF [bacterium HR19]|nr:Cytochrome c-type biogenesis protein CcmF [bacterium HR19]